MPITLITSIILLKINGLNTTITKPKIGKFDKNQTSTIFYL
jgi:hypothetical protein